MITMPNWWLYASGACFIISIVFNLALIVGAVVAWGKISPVLSEMREQVKRIGDKGSEIASTAKDTVENVHDRAEKILGTAQNASAQVTHRVGVASAALTAVFVVARVTAFIRGMMAHRHPRSITAS